MSYLSYKGKKYELVFQEFFPFFFDSQWIFKGFYEGFKKLGGFTYEAICFYKNGLQLEKYITLDEAGVEARIFAESKKDSPDFFVEQANEYRRQLKALEALVQEYSVTEWIKYTDTEVGKIFLDFHKKIEIYNSFSNFYYILSLTIESVLREKWKDENSENIQETLLALTTPCCLSISMKFSDALKKARDNYKRNRTQDTLKKETEILARDFFWLTSFSFPARTPESFISNIKDAVSDEVKKLEQPAIKLSVPEGWVAAMSVATYIKDDISTYFLPWYWHSLSDFWENIRQRIGLKTQEELWYFSYKEIAEFLSKSSVATFESLDERKAAILSAGGGHGVKILIGKDAKYFFLNVKEKIDYSAINEIRGNSAYPGKVEAKARVINNQSEFHAFRTGEILVVPYTAPEHIQLMRKSAAIVTDIGGLTCHAAIVARELKKPCIIGTKIATQVLKDGDLVEVDAEKGVVRILK